MIKAWESKAIYRRIINRTWFKFSKLKSPPKKGLRPAIHIPPPNQGLRNTTPLMVSICRTTRSQ